MTAPLYAAGPSGVTLPPAPAKRTLFDRLLFLLLPASCLGCGQPLAARAPLSLCAGCRLRLAPLPAATCAVCADPLHAADLPAGYRCGRCRERPPAFDRLLALWLYAPPLEAVIRGLKFGRLDYLGPQLGRALAEGLGGSLAGGDLVVPVPLHWRRRLARGYNQAERIAAPLARALGLPLSGSLVRRRATPPQSRLARAGRLANLRRAFRIRRPKEVAGRHVLLVDDVATTGATLDAAAAALKKAGAATVTAVVVGRTPSG